MKKSTFFIFITLIIFVTAGFFYKDSAMNRINIDSSDSISTLMESMTLRQKIGQIVVAGINGFSADKDAHTLIDNYYVSGFTFFKYNIDTEKQTRALVDDLVARNSSNVAGLFLAIDEEGGRVSRIPSTMQKGPSALSLGNSGDISKVYAQAQLSAQNLKALGFNLNFAPVCDIFSNPKNTVIGDRAFGKDSSTVSIMSQTFYSGLRNNDIIPCIKHFPGHGDTITDSHFGLPIVDKTKTQLLEFELIPFNLLSKAGAEMVMMSHILLPSIDAKNPSSLSENVINNLLIEQLGFEGVIITDDLSMGAISDMYSPGEAAVMAINAGCNLVLSSHNTSSQIEILESLYLAAENGEIEMKKIDNSVYKILSLKNKFGLI